MILSTERTSFDRITDTVWVGSRIRSDDDYHRLRALGIKACVDMREEEAEPWSFEAFLWLPTVDHRAPSAIHLQLGIAFLRQCERGGLPVFVHCSAGIGRSTTLVLAWLLAGPMRGEPTQAALDRIVARRPAANPNAAQVRAAEDAARAFEG